MKKLPLFLTAAASALAMSLSAQTVFTTPSGYVTIDLKLGFNPIGVNVHQAPEVTGVVQTETFDNVGGTSTITDGSTDFVSVLNSANSTYLLEITSGTGASTVAQISSITPSGVVIETSQTLTGAGAQFSIRKAFTLTDIFGSGADLKITGAQFSGTADIIFVPDGSGNYDQYFYSTNSNGFVPTDSPFGTPEPISIFYPDGLLVQIRNTNPDPDAFSLFGEVKTTPSAISTTPGFNLVSIPSPVGQKLSESGLENFLTSADFSGTADIIFVPDGNGNYVQYFFRTSDSLWKLADSPFGPDQGDTPINGAILIQRRGVTTSGIFQLPASFQNL